MVTVLCIFEGNSPILEGHCPKVRLHEVHQIETESGGRALGRRKVEMDNSGWLSHVLEMILSAHEQ